MNLDSQIKQDLAYAYQILAFLGLDDHTYTHLSSRSSDWQSYYIYPFGLRFEEVTADNLMRISLNGEVMEGSEYQYNKTGYVIHGSIYSKRNDINSIFHIHCPYTIAVSSCKAGLMPISQFALHFYEKISYHDYNSLSLEDSQANKLIEDLAENFNILLRNHGSISCGRTIYEAMFTYHLSRACKTQCITLSTNQELVIPNEELCKKSVSDLLSFEENLGLRDWQAWVRKFI